MEDHVGPPVTGGRGYATLLYMGIPSSDERASLAVALNVARVEQHMSIRAAARLAGVPAATVQGWLNGRYFPTPALHGEFSKLATALGLQDRLTPTLWTGPEDAPAIDPRRPPYLGLAPTACLTPNSTSAVTLKRYG